MIKKKDFDMVRKAFLIYDTSFSNHIFTYTCQHRKAKKLLEMNVQFEAGNFIHLCGIDYCQIDKQGSCKLHSKVAQFYRASENNKISLRRIKPKDDGTTDRRLQVTPLLEMLISPGVRVCDGGKFHNLQYEKAIRSSKIVAALACKENNKKYVPQSLLSLINQSRRSQSKSLTESHETAKISRSELNSTSVAEVYDKF